MISGAQIRAARALIGWTADDLAAQSDLGVAIIRRAESGDAASAAVDGDTIRRTLESAGIEFIGGDGEGVGVRLRANGSGGTIPAEDLNASNDE